MPLVDELPLICPRCGKTTKKPVAWVQQNVSFTCEQCSIRVPIDKDEAAQLLARLEDSV